MNDPALKRCFSTHPRRGKKHVAKYHMRIWADGRLHGSDVLDPQLWTARYCLEAALKPRDFPKPPEGTHFVEIEFTF